MSISQMLKSITAAGITGLSSVSVGFSDGHLTAVEIITAVIATLSSLALVWAVPNAPTALPLIEGHLVGGEPVETPLLP